MSTRILTFTQKDCKHLDVRRWLGIKKLKNQGEKSVICKFDKKKKKRISYILLRTVRSRIRKECAGIKRKGGRETEREMEAF